MEKLRAVCLDPRISEDFIWMMDDVFILREIKELSYYKL
jgi:hypothetical protein